MSHDQFLSRPKTEHAGFKTIHYPGYHKKMIHAYQHLIISINTIKQHDYGSACECQKIKIKK